MNSRSDIPTNIFGEQEKKEDYQPGELVVTYVHTARLYKIGIILEKTERDWVGSMPFKNIYRILIQNPESTESAIVERYSTDIYLPHMKEILNQELQEIKSGGRPYTIPGDIEQI